MVTLIITFKSNKNKTEYVVINYDKVLFLQKRKIR